MPGPSLLPALRYPVRESVVRYYELDIAAGAKEEALALEGTAEPIRAAAGGKRTRRQYRHEPATMC
jgi:hypothetical protein